MISVVFLDQIVPKSPRKEPVCEGGGLAVLFDTQKENSELFELVVVFFGGAFVGDDWDAVLEVEAEGEDVVVDYDGP